MKHIFTFSLFLISTFANAQTVCDSLDFVSIQYSPFTDTVIVVHVENNNTNEIFDYPGFVLLNDNNDTVAVENVNFFGIAGESVHSLNVRPGVHDPLTNFEGTLQLYSDSYGTFECEWDIDQSLCADKPCDSLVIGFQNWGGALVLGNFAWSVLDSSGTVVENGILEMTANDQYWFHGLCLAPGEYSYNLYALNQPSGGGPTMTASSSTTYAAPAMSMPFDWNAGNIMELPFYLPCISPESPNVIERSAQKKAVKISRNGNSLVVNSETPIQQLEVISLDGKLLHASAPKTTRFVVEKPILNGLFVVRVVTEEGATSQKVY